MLNGLLTRYSEIILVSCFGKLVAGLKFIFSLKHGFSNDYYFSLLTLAFLEFDQICSVVALHFVLEN